LYFFWRGQAILEGQHERAAFGVPLCQIETGEEVARLAFGVVFGDAGRGHREAHAVFAHQVSDFEGVVAEGFAGLDVILVAVGPVEEDFLAIVRHGIGLAAAVAPLGDEVAIFVVDPRVRGGDL
jgi:hypothetical protein